MGTGTEYLKWITLCQMDENVPCPVSLRSEALRRHALSPTLFLMLLREPPSKVAVGFNSPALIKTKRFFLSNEAQPRRLPTRLSPNAPSLALLHSFAVYYPLHSAPFCISFQFYLQRRAACVQPNLRLSPDSSAAVPPTPTI